MKVVLFCGGKGIRLRRGGDNVPKPMVRIGYRPIMWHLMKYYAHFGHKDFILALGYKADYFKNYFLKYDECLSNDFTIEPGEADAQRDERIELFSRDIADWRITFVDTGLNSNIGMRLRAVREHLKGEEMFLANYSDGLSDLHLPTMVDSFKASNAVASFLCVRPQQSFHLVRMDQTGQVQKIEPMAEADVWINGGFFALRNEIFDHIEEGDELVVQPFERLIKKKRLMAHKFTGFWVGMDTFKDKQLLEAMHSEGRAVWQVWKNHQEA